MVEHNDLINRYEKNNRNWGGGEGGGGLEVVIIHV